MLSGQLYRMTPLVSGMRHLSVSSSMTAAASQEMPKRPASPFASFYKSQIGSYKKSYPNLAIPDLMRKIRYKYIITMKSHF